MTLRAKGAAFMRNYHENIEILLPTRTAVQPSIRRRETALFNPMFNFFNIYGSKN